MLSLIPLNALAVEKSDNSGAEVDVEVAATIAMLFVRANLDGTTWDKTTNIDSIIPLYNNEDEINGYCINLVTQQSETGYVVVSTNLYESLIQEYSDTAAVLVDEMLDNTTKTTINEAKRTADRIYYYGPLFYSTAKQDVNTDNNTKNTENYENNYQFACSYISELRETGLLPLVATFSANVIITDPITYLNNLYPNATITNVDWYNIGDSSIYGYIINDYMACGVYGTAAIIKYYEGGTYSYSDIVDACKTIARLNGYASQDEESGEWNYYIALGSMAPYVQLCINAFSLSKTASSSLLSWSTGTSEISNDRPVLLNIWYSEQYDDHTVTAYAWTRFSVLSGGLTEIIRFFKVKDGYAAGSRYVNYETVTGSYITKVY